ncbi:uncharacterized protein LOC112638008 [Camponotus floridanus]|nr:uncharacterized protein LOC112637846 isoform X1 [Camponotus floridanus]XP_025264640.1 uncharacterized protein LOC112638008 [Camponotus floridanus]
MKTDPYMFFRYTRMSVNVFNHLLEIMKPFLTKKSHRALVPEQRLALTLRYLATGNQILSIALAYRIGESTARNVIKETCAMIIKEMELSKLLRSNRRETYSNTSTAKFWKSVL